MKSSQSRVAKIEAGDPSVSLDLLVRAVLSAGATKKGRQGSLSNCEVNDSQWLAELLSFSSD